MRHHTTPTHHSPVKQTPRTTPIPPRSTKNNNSPTTYNNKQTNAAKNSTQQQQSPQVTSPLRTKLLQKQHQIYGNPNNTNNTNNTNNPSPNVKKKPLHSPLVRGQIIDHNTTLRPKIPLHHKTPSNSPIPPKTTTTITTTTVNQNQAQANQLSRTPKKPIGLTLSQQHLQKQQQIQQIQQNDDDQQLIHQTTPSPNNNNNSKLRNTPGSLSPLVQFGVRDVSPTHYTTSSTVNSPTPDVHKTFLKSHLPHHHQHHNNHYNNNININNYDNDNDLATAIDENENITFQQREEQQFITSQQSLVSTTTTATMSEVLETSSFQIEEEDMIQFASSESEASSSATATNHKNHHQNKNNKNQETHQEDAYFKTTPSSTSSKHASELIRSNSSNHSNHSNLNRASGILVKSSSMFSHAWELSQKQDLQHFFTEQNMNHLFRQRDMLWTQLGEIRRREDQVYSELRMIDDKIGAAMRTHVQNRMKL